MGGMKVSELDFVRLLPFFMQDDEAVISLSNAVNHLIGEPGKRLSTIRTWDRIEELNDPECDEMAWELDIDWYDSTAGLDEKRKIIASAQKTKSKRGTKWAIEQILQAYFGGGRVEEWYEYGGEPYHFRVTTEYALTSQEIVDSFRSAAEAAKRASAHLDSIIFAHESNTATAAIGTCVLGAAIIHTGTAMSSNE